MATVLPRGPFRDETFVASESLASYQYHLVKLASATTVALAGSDEKAIGVVQNAPAINELAIVRTAGQSLCMVDGTSDIALMDAVHPDGSSHAIVSDADKAWAVGFSREVVTSATPALTVIDVFPHKASV